jgi:hypothetical protein
MRATIPPAGPTRARAKGLALRSGVWCGSGDGAHLNWPAPLPALDHLPAEFFGLRHK